MMAAFTSIVHPWNQEIWQSLTHDPERSNHALLLTGNPGLGKLDLALSLAHFVLTENHSQSENLFNAGSHPDFHVIAPENAIVAMSSQEGGSASPGDTILSAFAQRYLEQHSGKPKKTVTIDQIRSLASKLTTHPHISKTRVILIFCAETMNRNAANALLKNLEEPPANTLFILVSDELSKLAKTIRSRCSLINFRAPDSKSAKAWLEHQDSMPPQEVVNHLAMANDHPLLAQRLHQEGYIDSLKGVFTDVNGLWNRAREPIQVAKHWQELGGIKCVEILQKLVTDILKSTLSDQPLGVFFPVQEAWVKSVGSKISRKKLLTFVDELNDAKRMLNTTVDELLVLETVSIKLSDLPS